MLRAAERQCRRRQRLAASVLAVARAAWRLLDRDALDLTSGRLLARLMPALTAGQLAAATSGAAYVRSALLEQDLDDDPAGEVVPSSLSGVASDGRGLDTLLLEPVIAVKTLIGRGKSVDDAMRSGRFRLERIVATQVADAGRVAGGVAVVTRRGVGYVRMINPPSCSRCVILAGRRYRWNAGFQRHPLCDCIHIPTGEATAGDLTVDPRAYFDSLDEAQQNRLFTTAGAQAIRDGADMAKVVNARRGMSTAAGPSGRRRLATETVLGRQAFVTREGVSRRRAAAGGVRLMPEQIYRDAESRDDAIRLLRLHGYVT